MKQDEEEAPLENCHESIQKVLHAYFKNYLFYVHIFLFLLLQKPRTSGRKKNSIEPMETNV